MNNKAILSIILLFPLTVNALLEDEFYPVTFTDVKSEQKIKHEAAAKKAAVEPMPNKLLENKESPLTSEEQYLTPIIFDAVTPNNNKILTPLTADTLTPSKKVPLTPSTPSNPIKNQISLRETIVLVLDWHPNAKRSLSIVNQTEENINVARAGYYPSMQAGVKSGFDDKDKYYNNNKRELNSNLVVSATQTIYDFGRTSNHVQFAESSHSKEQHVYDKTIDTLAYNAANAFIEIIRYIDLVKAAKNQVDGFTEINKIAEKRAVLGASAYSDYSQAKVRLATVESLLYDYQGQLYKWSAILDNQVNQKIATKLSPTLPEDIATACMKINLREFSSPNVAVAKAEEAMAKSQLNAASSAYYPKLSITPSYEYQLDKNNNNYGGNRGNFSVYFNVSVPIMEGGAISARKEEAKQALLAAQSNILAEQTDTLQKILDASSQIESTLHSLRAKIARQSGARQTRDLYKQQYIELGNRPFSDLLNAEAEIHQTQMDIINSRYTINRLSVECLYQSGGLIDNLLFVK